MPVTDVGSGEVFVVFVHGVLDRGRSFRHVASLLEGDCRMRWYDRRGYGDAVDPDGPALGVPGHIDELVEILDGQRAVVVGHSFGGVIALGAAARAPELVQAVAVYESVLPWATGWGDEVVKGVLAEDDPESAALRLMLGDRYEAMSADEQARQRVFARAFVAEEGSARLAEPPYSMADIRAPVVYGRSDWEFLLPMPRYLKATLPVVEEMVIPGADHHAHRTAVEGFADLVRRAIALVPPPRAA